MTTNTVDPAQPTPSTVVVATDGSVTVTQVSNATTVTYPGVFSTTFSPLDLSPTLWLDASDETTITESGGAVSQWDDKSGNDYHVTQGTGTLQPTTGTRTINSLNVLDFDGSDELRRADESALRPSTLTVFVVIEPDSVTGRQDIVANGDSAAFSSNNWICGQSTTEQSFLGRTPAAVLSAGTLSTATPTIMRWVHDGSTVTGAIDGAATLNDTSTLGTDNTTGTFVGRSSAAGYYNGAVAEIIVVGSVLTAQQISDTETYLADKWGITL